VTPIDEWQLPTRHIGRRVLLFDRLESTNTLAVGLADDRRVSGTVILADEQSAGRGQHGRTWLSAAGQSVLMSLVLFPEGRPQPALLTAWAAVSVCRLIETVAGLSPRIKWPNDVLVPVPSHEGEPTLRKTCGILIEQQCRRGEMAAIVGIGLNVSQSAEEFEAARLPLATSLAAASHRQFNVRNVARTLITMLDDGYFALQSGSVQPLQRSWQDGLGLDGHDVLVECHNETLAGRLLDLSFSRLVLELPGGERRELTPETVRHVTRISRSASSLHLPG
jgi:BirA family biotin operon repressor/biotin-[acetyl-CoA-carboxylase] ligase